MTAEKRPAGCTTGMVLVVLIPLFIASMLALFLTISHTEVSGSLRAKGTLGTWTFAADDCSSGQRESFDGVVLTKKGDARLVRVVRDPIRGRFVVVVSPGRPNLVLSPESCSRFQVNVARTDTSINEIWAVDGNLEVECSDIQGSFKFEGCH